MSVERPRQGSRGFTLLEAVVAIALLALSLPAIVSAFAQASSNAARAEVHLAALHRAQDRIVIAKQEFRGQYGMQDGADNELRWTVTTSPLTDLESEVSHQGTHVVPVKLVVDVQAAGGRRIELGTVFLYEEPAR